MMSYDSMRRTSLTLYACWISYRFTDSDTTIAISNSQPAEYTIAEITIDPNAKIPNNPSIGSRLIVDYGE